MLLELIAAATVLVFAFSIFVRRAVQPFISPAIVIAPFLFAGWLGAAALHTRGSPYGGALMWIDTGFLLVMSITFWLFRGRSGKGSTSTPGMSGSDTHPASRAQLRGIVVTAVLFCLVTAYHFSVTGIPILSGNAELARWNFTGSGLLGIPGRIYSYGLTGLYVLVACIRSSTPSTAALGRSFTKVQLWLGVFIALTRVLGGFRGEVLAFVVVVLACELVARPGIRLRAALRNPRLVGAVVLATVGPFLYAFAVGSTYKSTEYFSQTTGISSTERFIDRLTGSGVEPGRIAVASREQQVDLVPGLAVTNDFRYYTSRYVPGVKHDGHDLNTVLSAKMSGRLVTNETSSNPQDFLVPVTPGLPAFVWYDFGFVGMLAAGILVGSALAKASAATRSRQPLRMYIGTIALLAAKDIVLKGNPWYQVYNWPLAAAGTYVLVYLLSIERHVRSVGGEALGAPTLVDPHLQDQSGGATVADAPHR